MIHEVAVIGSGLAAVAACAALIERGFRPVMLDVGKELPEPNNNIAASMGQQKVSAWRASDRVLVNENNTVHGNQHPKKLLFGSDYFYGRAEEAKITCLNENVDSPPYSFAKGGFSVGWGASVLFPDQADLVDWPIRADELLPYFKEVMQALPYSAADDGLALNFPLMHDSYAPVKLTQGNHQLLQNMQASNLLKPNEVVFGQARLLLKSNDCQYCGGCLSGCVYGAIYKANQTLDGWIQKGLVDYRTGVYVERLEETVNGVNVYAKDANGVNIKHFSHRIYLAAGVVNSTAIVMKSKHLYQQSATVKTTFGFIAPLFSFKKLPLDWPNNNTMPGIFLEYKDKKLSDSWIHTQLSTPNELVLKKLGIKLDGNNPIQKMKRKLAEHLVVAHGNMHSNGANHYQLSLNKNAQNGAMLNATREDPTQAKLIVKSAVDKLAELAPTFGCHVIKPFVQDTTQAHGFHLGASMPMKKNPSSAMETDTLGRPLGWKKIHVVDSSVFPSIPATTVGVLAMANARRIAIESMS